MPRIGFCCKFSYITDRGLVPIPELNGRSTTMRWLREHRAQAESRLYELIDHNTRAALALVQRVGSLRPELRMVRLGSELLPGYTEATWQSWWQRPDVQARCQQGFEKVGAAARELDVRLSFHPGQFCCLASDSDDIVNRSIAEFEYHADMARWMGYGSTWHDRGFKINVHLSGRGGVARFLQTLTRLSPEARNLITIENDEMSTGLDVTLELVDHVALVLDIHHHWVRTGEYILPQDQRVRRVIDSWRGQRPVLHYSVSREDELVGHDPEQMPDLQQLLAQGHRRQRLRAHSDFYWNQAVNRWAAGFAGDFDIQCESKAKNLSSFDFAEKFVL